MNFDLSDEQKMLADQVRTLLAEHADYDRLRKLIDAGEEWDAGLWSELAALGVLGANVPEAFGGVGLTELDLGVVSEALGRANAAVPFFSSIVLAADAIRLAGTDAQKAAWLPGLASGETIGCFAYAEGVRGWRGAAVTAEYSRGRLTGVKTPVADAGIAGLAVVLCRVEGSLALAVCDLSGPGLTRVKLDSTDQLRAHYRLEFKEAEAELLGGAKGTAIVETLFDRAAVQAAFEAVGGAEACLFMARDYAMERQMFGRPLASYQAIKHRLADIALATELARSNAYFAGWAAGDAPDELPGAAAAARLSACVAFEQAARENLQVHGGIGYTFVGNCHFYYRRERTLALSLGGREYWADRVIAHLPGRQAASQLASEA